MPDCAFAMFDTPIGVSGLVWRRAGIAGVQLPEGSPTETRARVLRRFRTAIESVPSPSVQEAIDGIVALLSGAAADLTSVVLDEQGVASFNRRVYAAARAIGPGATATYGEVARRIGVAGSARAVGQALGQNPFALIVPCHRVLAAGGHIGGFSARGGAATKLRILAIEGARIGDSPDLFSCLATEPSGEVNHLPTHRAAPDAHRHQQTKAAT